MKLRYLFVFAISAALFATGCVKEDIISTLDSFQAESVYAIIPEGWDHSEYTFTAGAPWSVTSTPSWVTVTPSSGSAGTQTVTISATDTESTREGDIIFELDGKKQIVHVKQVAAEAPVVYSTIKEVLDGENDKVYYVTGTVTKITTLTYGNWYIADETGQLYIYGTRDKKGNTYDKTTTNENLNDPDNPNSWMLSVGDKVTISGPRTVYSGTVELVDVTIINIEKSLLEVDPTEIKAPAEGMDADVKVLVKDGTLGFNSDVDWLSVTGMDALGDTTLVHVKIAENTAYDKRSGVMTFTAEAGSAKSSVSVNVSQAAAIDPAAAAVYTRATKIVSGRTYVIVAGNNMAQNVPVEKNYGYLQKEDDVVVTELGTINTEHPGCEFVFTAVNGGYTICQADGRYLHQKGTFDSFNVSAEPDEGEVWTVSIDAGTGAATITNTNVNKFVQWDSKYNSYGSYSDARGELPILYEKNDISKGTADSPYTVAKAIEILDSGDIPEENVYVKGIINKIDNVNLEYGNAQFWISDDGTTAAFELYRSFWFGGEKYTSEDQIKVGDEVVMCGQLKKYGETFEMGEKNYLYSLNGKTE